MRRSGIILCFGVPLAVLALAYAWMAFDHQRLLLWNVTVHESGDYTFGETVFYARHFLREIPIVLAMALFVLAGYTRVAGVTGTVHRGRARAIAWGALGGALLLMALALGATARQLGLGEALHDLLQFRTRDTLSAYGSHWHFHWLSTLWFGVAASLAARPLAGLLGDAVSSRPGRGALWRWGGWLYVAALTIVFGLSAEIFIDVRYAGHQAREILTHGPVTLLLAFGVLHATARWLSASSGETPSALRLGLSGAAAWFQLVLFLIIPAYLAVVTLSGDFMAVGQSQLGLAAMVGAHYFEHFLDYLLAVLLVSGGFAGWVLRRSR